MQRYLSRVYDGILSRRLAAKGAVLIEGPKWCGKTTTAQQIAQSAIDMQDPRTKTQNIRLAQIAPDEILKGTTPRLIDEWQVAPQLWDAVRHEVDERDEFGQFILTGSSVPPDVNEISHTGTGRIARMKMGTMSLLESEDSTGGVSLKALFDGEEIPVSPCESDLRQLAFLVCRGGWPKAIGQTEHVALQQAFDYYDAVVETDVSRADGVKRSANYVRMLMRSYARMVSSQGSLASMREDLVAAGTPLGESAFREYIEALRKIFVIEDLDAWCPNLRSRTAVRTSPTRHFADPSIAVAALGTSPSELIGDLNTFGLIFEDLCIRDLRAYARTLDGEVFHYRDKDGLECDAVIRLRNGCYGLIEIKLGGDDAVEAAALSLKKLVAKIDVERMRTPSFLMVLTGVGEYSYPREDGIAVVPVRSLGI